MKFTIFVVLLLIFKFDQLLAAGIFEIERKVIYVDIFSSCKSNMTTDISNVVLSEEGNRKTLINATFQIHRDISPNLELLFKIIRCKNKETLDNCVELTATRVKEGCKLLAAKNQISSSVFQNIRPSFACPIKKGNYTLVNGWIDADRQPFPLDRNSYWKAFISAFEKPGNAEVMCLRLEGGLIPVKN